MICTKLCPDWVHASQCISQGLDCEHIVWENSVPGDAYLQCRKSSSSFCDAYICENSVHFPKVLVETWETIPERNDLTNTRCLCPCYDLLQLSRSNWHKWSAFAKPLQIKIHQMCSSDCFKLNCHHDVLADKMRNKWIYCVTWRESRDECMVNLKITYVYVFITAYSCMKINVKCVFILQFCVSHSHITFYHHYVIW